MGLIRGIRKAAVFAVAVIAVAIAAGAGGCSEEGGETPESVVSRATEKISEAVESQMAEVRDGINAKGDVRAGPTEVDKDGRTTAMITATNTTEKAADYTIQVNFRDPDGNLLDAVVLTIDAVPSGGSQAGTARSNRDLSGTTTAEIARALRH
ncbi:hypothetical protein [Streptomyces sp. NPDC000410]|uniref:hypothetical protein n=1 Tax=Streptomyces sp. NPDC000410 TaxID=3154254 RepID=UPI0033316B45